MILCSAYGVYENGYLDKQEYSNYVATVIITLLIDLFVFDIIIVFYAFLVYDSPFLTFLAFRGFYIRAT